MCVLCVSVCVGVYEFVLCVCGGGGCNFGLPLASALSTLVNVIWGFPAMERIVTCHLAFSSPLAYGGACHHQCFFCETDERGYMFLISNNNNVYD